MKNSCSDRLYRLQDSTDQRDQNLTFDEIMELYRGQISEELGPPFDDFDMERSANEMHIAADQAEEIYEQYDNDSEAAEALQESENEAVAAIGAALESGDWSTVAI